MNNQKHLKKYTNSVIVELSKYLRKGMKIKAKIYPVTSEGALIELVINENNQSNIEISSTVPRVNDALNKVDQNLISGNIQGVTFKGTNLYMDGKRILIIKGEDTHNEWSNAAVQKDIKRIVSPRGDGNAR